MGTSLNGLTPATTFDGLLKTSDNDAITSSLKTIGSGDGTDSCLQLSDSALKVNSGAVTIVGTGNTDTTTSLLVQNSDGTTLLKVVDDGEVRIGDTTGSLTTEGNNVFLRGTNIYFRERLGGYIGNFREEGLQIGNGSAASAARLQVKGSGATSATTSLLVQNSGGDDILSISDDRNILINNQISVQHRGFGQWLKVLTAGVTSNVSLYGYGVGNASHNWQTQSNYSGSNFRQFNTGFSFGAGALPPDTADTLMTIKGSGNDATTTSLLVQNSDGTNLLSLNDQGDLIASQSNGIEVFRVDAGNRMFRVNQNNHSTIDFQFRGTSENNLIRADSSLNAVGFGAINPSARVHIKGSGATSATTSLLVQNSAGDDMFKTTDDGGTTLKSFGASNTLILDASSGVSAFQMNSSNGQQRFRIQATSSATRFTPNNSNDAFTFVGNGIYTSSAFDIPSARLHVKGQGATSATTALLVENSAGTDLFKVDDAGSINIQSFKQLSASSSNFGIILEGTTSMQFKSWNKDFRFFTQNGVVAEIKNDGSTIIGGSTPDASAKLQVDSTTQGFLPPRMTGEQIDAIESPASGLIIYNTTTNKAVCYNGTSWNDMF